METTYRFGHVEVRPAERQLLVGGQPAAIGARAFDVLLALIDRRDRVVGKDELLALAWPGVVVEENNLQVQVSTLRKLLGPRAVTTIPGRGYRFTLVPEAAGVPPSAGLATRHNLLAPLTRFIGRDKEVAEVRALLATSRLVTLTSLGGTGKTRLSLEVATGMLEAFPDGVWLVELGPLSDERRVAQAVALLLEVGEERGKPIVEALAAAIRDKRMLLVLDNCEHLLRGCAEVAKQLLQACPQLRILASSREPLHVAGEAVYRVPPLAAEHAVQLFVDRAQAADTAFQATDANATALREICRRLDGIPLAIELAAARVRALSLDNILTRLDDRFRLLTGGDPTALPRHQTLRASIEWSHDLLSAPERTLLRRLAVFSGGWTLDAAEAVAADGEVQEAAPAFEVLTQLIEKSLVARDATGERYQLLETVREFALERLRESGEERAIRDRHLAFYLALAKAAHPELVGPDQAAWLARLDGERENLLSAHAWCDHAKDGQELGLALVSMTKQYWFSRGMPGLAYGAMVEALARAPQRSRSRCRALFDAGQVGYFMGLFREARLNLEEAVALGRELGDREITSRALQPLGMACVGVGDMAAGRAYLEEALEVARQDGDPRNITAAVNSMAQFHRAAGDLDAAEPLYAHVLDLARAMGDPTSIAVGLLNRAMVAIDRGRDGVARPLLSEALEIATGLASRPGLLSVVEVCAGLAAQLADWPRAARLYGTAEAEAARTGIRRDPADEAFLAPWMRKAASAVGEVRFQALVAEGRARPLEAALEEARAWLPAASS